MTSKERTNCVKIGVEVFSDELDKDAVNIVKNGLEHFRKQVLDVIIIYTAGRHKEEKGLLEEMKDMYQVSEPDLVLLVIGCQNPISH